MSRATCHQSRSPFASYRSSPECNLFLRTTAISGESAKASSNPKDSQSAMASPMTTTEVVGATASGFASAFFGGGARELSTGACCSVLSNCLCPPPNNPPPKNPPPLGRCGRCRFQNPSPKNCACAGELTASSSAARPAKSTAARRAAPTSQRETRFFPVMRCAKSTGRIRQRPHRHGPLAPEKCQLKGDRAAILNVRVADPGYRRKQNRQESGRFSPGNRELLRGF